MYKKNSNSLVKHMDFIIQDIIIFCVSFWAAYAVRHQDLNLFNNSLYILYMILIVFISIAAGVVLRSYKSILFRGYLVEFRKVFALTTSVFGSVLFILFFMKDTESISRFVLLVFYILSTILIYLFRCWRKVVVIRKTKESDGRSVFLVGTYDAVLRYLERLEEREIYDFSVNAIAICDEACIDEEARKQRILNYLNTDIKGIRIVAIDREEALDYIENNVVDEIVFTGVSANKNALKLLSQCEKMGLTVHIVIDELLQLVGDTTIEKMAGVPVASSTIKLVSQSDLLLKRFIDICGALVGLLITVIATIFVAPAIYISDPGPIFFSQERIGKNGRKFKIYKFRSMYKDAEARKAELMKYNEMNGLMFKMENDPRIIGSGKDGTKKGVGWFIRAFSIDELPQFWNILIGDMSLVGTRPPTVDEWEQYDKYQQIRMRIKPGLTGLWQVSGRSDITDFEEVISLDTEYMRSWSFMYDVKIIFETVKVVFKKAGAK